MKSISTPEEPVRRALVLAAGNGDRFVNGTRQSKLLHRVLGQPLLVRTLDAARAAGITSFEIVLGYQADLVRRLLDTHMPGVDIKFSYNPDWRLENGISVLAAERNLRHGPFALLMGDHLFDASSLRRLLADGDDLRSVELDFRRFLDDFGGRRPPVDGE